MSEQTQLPAPAKKVARPADPDVVAVSTGRVIKRKTPRPATPRHEREVRARGPPKDVDVDVDAGVDAYSIQEFCKRHGISPSFFHKLVKAGLGPATLKVGSRTLVTRESAAAWRAERVAASAD